MKGPPLGPGGEAITWPNQVAPRGRRAHSTRNVKPQTSNLQPRFPPPPASPLARRVVPRAGGAAGWLGVPYVRTRSTRPQLSGGPGVRGRGGRQPGSLFSGSEGNSIALRAPVSRAAGVGLPGGTLNCVPADVVSPRIRGYASPPHVLARGRLGGVCVPRLRGPWPAGGSTLGRWSAPTPSCARHQGSGALPAGHRATLPASRHQPPRLPAPSPVGSAVTCASACVGAGAAAVAGSSGCTTDDRR